jgi:uncharacterized membrane protein
MKRTLAFVFGAAFVVALAGCAARANPVANTPGADGVVAGFWQGLWHGIICVITFIISLFDPSVGVYEVHNNGAWYNFGFVLGILTVGGGGGRAASR